MSRLVDKTKILNSRGLPNYREIQGLFPDDPEGSVYIWGYTLEALFQINAHCTIPHTGGIEPLKFQVCSFMWGVRDAPPPEGQPLFGDYRHQEDFLTVLQTVGTKYPGVITTVIGIMNDLSGFNMEQRVNFTAPVMATSSES
jgi:hypothetical protein